MAPPPENRTAALAFVAVIGLSAVAALGVLLRREKPGSSPSAKRSSAWLDTAPPQVQDPSMISQEPERTSVDLVGRPPGMDWGTPKSKTPAAAGAAAQAGTAATAGTTAAAARPDGDGGPTGGLSAREQGLLDEKAGRDMKEPREADAVGKSDGLWSKLLKGVAGHPRIMAYILNNQTLVDAFMSRPKSVQNCRSATSFTNYLADTKRANGVTHAMNVFEDVLHGHPDMPTVMFGSKLADAIQKCPSTQSIVKSPEAISTIAQSNTRIVGLLLDPALMKGLAASPAAMASFQSVQNNLGQ